MRSFLLLLFICSTIILKAQPSPELDIARTFMRQGDYGNAVLVLKRAHEDQPANISLAKDLALCYYYQQENEKGLDVITPTLDNPAADDQCYQIAANLLIAKQLSKDAIKLYKKGLKRFPDSGALYNDLGELQWKEKDVNAIRLWEKGIEEDPAYAKNYYNAARYYYLSIDKVWCLIYGEIYVNMEPSSARSGEIKDLLIESYKKLFTDTNLDEVKTKNEFSRAYLQTMQQQSSLTSAGINTESLIMIRTRFILDWNNSHAKKFPFRLFDYHKQLLQQGLFEAYNHWLFTSVTNLSAYQNWVNTHSAEFSMYDRIQKNILFRMPSNQYYNN